MELYRLKVVENFFNKKTDFNSSNVISEVFFEKREIAFESLLRSYLNALDDILIKSGVSVTKQTQRGCNSYPCEWRIECSNSEEMTEFSYTFYLDLIKVQQEVQPNVDYELDLPF